MQVTSIRIKNIYSLLADALEDERRKEKSRVRHLWWDDQDNKYLETNTNEEHVAAERMGLMKVTGDPLDEEEYATQCEGEQDEPQ
jgi:hypothetical protein